MAKDGFEGYKSEEFPLYGGWVTSQELIAEDAALPIVDKYEYASGMQSLRLKSGDGGAALMVKRFALPDRFPFDTSDANFAIANEAKIAVRSITAAESLEKTSETRAGDRERRQERLAHRQKAAKSASREDSAALKSKSAQSAETQAGAGTDATTRTLSASTNGGSFYIYSITGVLLAEYSRYSDTVPVKDYIYIGNKLLAEYKPQESRTYFYTPDQINSTRIVTDSTGTVVYSAAHDPYGGIQQTWENTYGPTSKFSGKERDSESGLDYFGARYYDRSQYRFISVDPVISPEAIGNAQRWNLYSYCGNNPISFIDPEGRCYLVFYSGQNIIEFYSGAGDLIRTDRASNRAVGGRPPYSPGHHPFQMHKTDSWENYWPGMDAWGILLFLQNDPDNPGAGVHAGYRPGDWEAATYGCIRTTPWAMCNYVMYMEDHPEDPMTELIVVPWEPFLPGVWPPLLELPVQPIVTLVIIALPPPRILPLMF